MYVPTLVSEVLKSNANGELPKINLQACALKKLLGDLRESVAWDGTLTVIRTSVIEAQ